MGVSWNISGVRRDGWALAIAPQVLTRRLLRRGARYRHENYSAVAGHHPFRVY